MRHVLKIAGIAVLLGAGGVAGSEPAAAQLSVQIGSDRGRVIERHDYRRPRVIERHVIRPEPRRKVCTTKWRTTYTSFGRRITRPIETCRYR
jgi:hypothetical protein